MIPTDEPCLSAADPGSPPPPTDLPQDAALEMLRSPYERSLDCVHCGLCLPPCPTYRVSGHESDSPRGRILLIRAMAEGRLSPDDASGWEALDGCLDCRACESACPSGVTYGRILEETRRERPRLARGSLRERSLRFLLDRFIASPRGRKAALEAAVLLRALGLDRLLSRLPVLPGLLRHALSLGRSLPPRSSRRPIPPGLYPAEGPPKARIGLFTGCLMEDFFGNANRAALSLLRRCGLEVLVPSDQGCCGALHLHQGFEEACVRLLERNFAAFEGVDFIVSTAAGCGSTLREAGAIRGNDRACAFSSRVLDLSVCLDRFGPPPRPRAVPLRVVWDDPCHLRHAQGITEEPRRLLRGIPGLRLLEVEASESCCGSAGIYNLRRPETADAILERRLEALLGSGAEAVVTGNPGCQLQIANGLRARRSPLEVFHLAEILERAAGGGETAPKAPALNGSRSSRPA